jgi:hypothetical protein
MPTSPSSIKKANICGKCKWWVALNAITNKGWGKCEFVPTEGLPKCAIFGYVEEKDDKNCSTFKEK